MAETAASNARPASLVLAELLARSAPGRSPRASRPAGRRRRKRSASQLPSEGLPFIGVEVGRGARPQVGQRWGAWTGFGADEHESATGADPSVEWHHYQSPGVHVRVRAGVPWVVAPVAPCPGGCPRRRWRNSSQSIASGRVRSGSWSARRRERTVGSSSSTLAGRAAVGWAAPARRPGPEDRHTGDKVAVTAVPVAAWPRWESRAAYRHFGGSRSAAERRGRSWATRKAPQHHTQLFGECHRRPPKMGRGTGEWRRNVASGQWDAKGGEKHHLRVRRSGYRPGKARPRPGVWSLVRAII